MFGSLPVAFKCDAGLTGGTVELAYLGRIGMMQRNAGECSIDASARGRAAVHGRGFNEAACRRNRNALVVNLVRVQYGLFQVLLILLHDRQALFGLLRIRLNALHCLLQIGISGIALGAVLRSRSGLGLRLRGSLLGLLGRILRLLQLLVTRL